MSLLKFVVTLLSLSLSAVPSSGLKDGEVPGFAFSWLDEKNSFLAGDIATIIIKVLQSGNSLDNVSQFRPVVTVNRKAGNSTYISGVSFEHDGNPDNWRIVFIPIMAGLFNVIVTEEQFKVLDSSLHFQVTPGPIYPSVSTVTWMGLVHEFDAGEKAALLVLLKDSFGNNLTSSNEALDSYNFTIPMLYGNGSLAVMQSISSMNWNQFGYIVIELMAAMAGNFSLQVLVRGQNIDGSPLPYQVNPGTVDVSSCMARWKFETNAWQIFSRIEIFIHQMDKYGNLVKGLLEFDASVLENKTKLELPVPDFHFQEATPGIQMLSFSAVEAGDFLLNIYNAAQNKSINNMPYTYTVYVGYCDGSKSVLNGTGLNKSVAGEVQVFSVFLNDLFQYPFLAKAEMLRVNIVRQNDSHSILPSVYPVQSLNGSTLAERPIPVAPSLTTSTPASSANFLNESKVQSSDRASQFSVSYTPEKSGTYEITVYCGNIILNHGYPIIKEVISGEANVSNSVIMKLEPKVPKMIRNEVIVNLMDSFCNPVISQQSRLKFHIASANSSGFRTWLFTDNKDGSYSGFYQAMDIGTYDITVLFDDLPLSFCPFMVNVYRGDYFPKAYDDEVSVWEDESTAFDVLLNDYYAGDNATIVNFNQPGHGSLLQYGHLFRYTPYKKFYGSDTFGYTIVDVNGNLDDASVNIRVMKIPPQFVAFPVELEATEDVVTPKSGGYSGLKIAYSDLRENLSVSISALFGTVSLSPLMMEFWPDGISIIRVNNEAKDLVIEGQVEPINSALQCLQYLGNKNFSGGDTIRLSARNQNGRNDLDVPIYVEPINDVPFFRLPDSIILKYDGEEALIFDKNRDKFEFIVDDPDLADFPGGESQFLVSFSVEVSDGFLTTVLPSDLINTTELKLKTTYQWQPLHTYVTIAKHFKIKATGIRFRGKIKDCNDVMQHLYFHGEGFGALLMFEINDLGNYGCYPDCSEKLSMPLYARAKVNLIRRSSTSSLLTKSLGSVLVIELVMVSALGLVLLFFLCKCAVLLAKERIRRDAKNGEVSIRNQSKVNSSNEQTALVGSCSSCFFLGDRPRGCRQRSVFLPVKDAPATVNQPTSLTVLSVEKQDGETLIAPVARV
ncbi:hypothetical protein MLD38_028731 [Melastoma candidum]|uniref:Uncharacterized protein n=1 Tax=Melastoma candidum TaxID=119954 RepID=A0ACB9N2G8_9MYRT|nr:hypothetical protein MLD38_028731 [Melastoma candidum]